MMKKSALCFVCLLVLSSFFQTFQLVQKMFAFAAVAVMLMASGKNLNCFIYIVESI